MLILVQDAIYFHNYKSNNILLNEYAIYAHKLAYYLYNTINIK